MRYSPHAAVAHQSTNLQIMANFHELIEGFHNFREEYLLKETEFFEELKHGQNPHTLVIACCDSRVDPAHVTRSNPGEMFVIRNVANLVPPYHPDSTFHGVSSAIEYAVCVLEVKHIIVLGHSGCGGIHTLMSEEWHNHPSEFLTRWLTLAEPARRRVKERLGDRPEELQLRVCEESSILLSMENLMTFPWIRERVEAGNLKIHGWYFNLHEGELYDYDSEKEEFLPLAGESDSL